MSLLTHSLAKQKIGKMFSTSYNVDSTKSFMEAMSTMTRCLNSLEFEKSDEIPRIDREDNKFLKDKLKAFNNLMPSMSELDTELSDEDLTDDSDDQFLELEAADTSLYDEIQKDFDRIESEKEISKGTNGSFLENVLQIISSSSSEEEQQSYLFDLLGFEEFDLISKLLQNKNTIIEQKETSIKKKEQFSANVRSQLMSASQREAMIKKNFEMAKGAKLLPSEYSASQRKYPHVFQAHAAGNTISFSGKKYSLPVGTTRENHGKYEEIIIPINDKKPRYVHDHRLVPINELDQLCIGSFKGYKTLNRVQSLVFPVAYQTNENMLICAPTGAGKTDIALLTILHTISQFMTQEITEEGDLQIDVNYNDFKIVYIAPLKALAAEIVQKFSSKLKWLNIQVRELTGDMQLTKAEIMNTQIIVTTPEKWDVVTRKASGDNELVSKVKLLIIDEVHLLHEDRGSVIETLVARTLRQVESTQSMIRVVGLSATLPNYVDVADFLGVNRQIGMFYFDLNFRPIPLRQEILGVREKAGSRESKTALDDLSYEKLVDNIKQGNQVMVFVHSRKDTVNTAKTFISMAQKYHESMLFDCRENEKYVGFEKEVMLKNRNKDLKELFNGGFGVHHAGMLRTDRNLVEKMFTAGVIKVLVCTATLAWGVNLPASTVIIKGTQIYDSKKGGFVDLGISDIIQIFGRAGRPQFEKYGTSILCTTMDRLDHYISLLTQQHPIESKLASKIVDNLNAEISLGTVMNVDEAVRWLGYTYLFVRMRQNPFSYGLEWKDLQEDPQLVGKRREMIINAARRLHSLQMIVFDERSSSFIAKDLGRIASEFYLLNDSIEIFNKTLNPRATEADVLAMISVSSEFDNITFRQDEEQELKQLLDSSTECQVAGDISSPQTKTNILLQSFISKSTIRNSALVSDLNYVAQNSARICRALLFVGINRRWGLFSRVMLELCKSIDKQLWHFEHPLSQFDLPQQIMRILKAKNPSIDSLKDMSSGELGDLVHNKGMGKTLSRLVSRFPNLFIDAEIFPITANVMRVHVEIEPDFVWDKKFHGNLQMFWIFVETNDSSQLLHIDKLLINARNFKNTHELDFMIPLADPLPPQIVISAVSDTWIGSEAGHTVSFQHLIRPSNETLTTKLLKLQPLPITALHDKQIESIYSSRFNYFNAMQTMVFHSLYNTNSSAFLGSPTGSGKTIAAELAIWHALREFPNSKIVYIAPMKALVRERIDDWGQKIACNTKYKLVELTGDSVPDARDVRDASIIVTTPEKFDGISRNWQTRKFVQKVSLVIMDEIHLLASDRGPILEMIVSRMNYIASLTKKPIRLLGMSTAVSNAMDMASWLGVKNALFNFPQAVRPVPLQMYIDGFPDNLAFCPLMKKMNKPAFMAIKQHSPQKPVLIFVASRRQTRLTALDLIHLCGLEDNPKRFLKMDEEELEQIITQVKDETLKLSLQFGIGLHHAGLVDGDRKIAHKLFEQNKIQILIATSTLAWGVNLPAHLVIIKGTQFFDAKIEGYRDMDLTDVLQMMGRAGRPAFDTTGIAIVYTKESKKMFYKHFLNVGFPVESSLHKVLDDHIGAEIASKSIQTQQDALDFLSWTFLFRRIYNNPTYYGIEDISTNGVSNYLTNLVDTTISNLKESKCLKLANKNNKVVITPTPFLEISSYYYLSHKTIRYILNNITPKLTFKDCLKILSAAVEYNELPTRHGEELINTELSQQMRYQVEEVFPDLPIWDPHVKTFLLLQAYMSRIELPIADYSQDTVTVLDQALRILQAYIDVAAELGYLSSVLTFVQLMWSIKQGHWFDDDPVYNLPGLKIREKRDTPMNDGGDIEEAKENRKAAAPVTNKELTLNDIGKMPRQKLEKLPLLKNNRKSDRFLKIASSLATGNLKISKQNNPSELEVIVERDNSPLDSSFKSYCSKYPKVQKEGWFFIIGDLEISELYLIKRVSPRFAGSGDKKGKLIGTFAIPEPLRNNELDIICINDAMDIQYRTKHVFI